MLQTMQHSLALSLPKDTVKIPTGDIVHKEKMKKSFTIKPMPTGLVTVL
uniref:Uncharacterized protein n=1 Tax=Rhizophora mucronata TaxID=61149 RepID=A0A2P2QDB8_RHIMU